MPDATIALDLAFLPSSIIETPADGDSSNAIQEPSPLEGEGQGEGVAPRAAPGYLNLLLAAEEISGRGQLLEGNVV